MRASVVIPFRNAESTLGVAIESILNQSIQDFELILIDNASTDDSLEIAHSFLDPRTIIHEEPKVGVVHAANRGIQEARGEFVARMDADDVSSKTRLEKQVELLLKEPDIGLVSGGVESLVNPTEGFQRYLDWINTVKSSEDIYLNQFVEFPLVNPSVMFRRELIEQFGGFREGQFPEDYEFFLRLCAGGVKMKKVDATVLHWNDLADRLTRTHPSYTDEAFNYIKAKYLVDWLKKHNVLHPEIWVWGAGKQARKKCAELEIHGIRIVGYIDVNQKEKSGDRPVIHFEELPDIPDRFIVSYVSNWGAREEIRNFLKSRNWEEGKDFILAS